MDEQNFVVEGNTYVRWAVWEWAILSNIHIHHCSFLIFWYSFSGSHSKQQIWWCQGRNSKRSVHFLSYKIVAMLFHVWCHCTDCCLFSGVWWEPHISSPVIMQSTKLSLDLCNMWEILLPHCAPFHNFSRYNLFSILGTLYSLTTTFSINVS